MYLILLKHVFKKYTEYYPNLNSYRTDSLFKLTNHGNCKYYYIFGYIIECKVSNKRSKVEIQD